MKQYFTGFFTGACLVASAVMFMGASESNSKIGKYQGVADESNNWLIDTETGHMWIYDYRYNKRTNKYLTSWYPKESAFFEE